MIHVLDNGFVKLTDFMGSDLSVVNTARISYDNQSKQLDDKDKKLLNYLWEHKHTSPFRHCMLQFHIKAPIFVLRQWMKHVVCKEQARMILPLNLYTECYWTASLQAVMNFLELREDSHSQWEIQQYAHAVRKLSESIFQYSLGELK
jgi:thymidylate synthase (FAD)